MAACQNPRYSFFPGAFVSVMLAAVLTHSIMSSGVNGELSLAEFFGNFSNVLYVIMMSLICLSAWFIKGQNNRTYILCWATGYVVNTLIFFVGLNYFLHLNRNVYILNSLGFISIAPLYLFCKYRLPLLNQIFILFGKIEVINKWSNKHLQATSVTSLTLKLDSLIIGLIVIELAFSLMMTYWSLYYQVPVDGSVGRALNLARHINYFTYYYYILDFWTVLFIVILSRQMYLDAKSPDYFDTIKRSVVDKKLNHIRSKKSKRD